MNTILGLCLILLTTIAIVTALFLFAAYRTERARRVALERNQGHYSAALDIACETITTLRQQSRVTFVAPCVACSGLPDARHSVNVN